MHATTPQEADDAWTTALLAADVDAATAFLHPEYALLVMHPVVARIDREEWLRTLPYYLISSWDVAQSRWDDVGDVAIHSQIIHQRAVVMGIDRNGPFSIVDVWVRDSGSWRVRLRQSVPLTAGELPRLPRD